MSISHYNPALYCSILIPGSFVVPANHSALSFVDVTKDGAAFTVAIMVGTNHFKDEAGNPVTPLGYLSNDEYFLLRTMLEHTDEDGELIERTLPLSWEDIDAMVIAMRNAAAAESTELGNEQEQQP